MSELIPNRQLFRYEVPLRRRGKPPKIDGDLSDWSDEFLMPPIHKLDGLDPFAPVYVAWDDNGLYIACRVTGKEYPLRCDPKEFWKGDNLRLCTDMRDARDIKRGTRFCQQFYFLPTGGGPGRKAPVAGSAHLHRAREHAPPAPPGRIEIAADVTRVGYTLEAHIPADCLSGFDPIEHRRIGLYYMLEDADHGQQYLTVGDDLYWWVDPSTWAAAVLCD
jgi:hypothetical protein